MQWFVDQGWDADEIEALRKEVVSQWGTSYKPAAAAAIPNPGTLPNPTMVAVAIVCIAVQLFLFTN